MRSEKSLFLALITFADMVIALGLTLCGNELLYFWSAQIADGLENPIFVKSPLQCRSTLKNHFIIEKEVHTSTQAI